VPAKVGKGISRRRSLIMDITVGPDATAINANMQ